MGSRNEFLIVRASAREKISLRMAAEARGTTVSELVRQAVAELIAPERGTHDG